VRLAERPVLGSNKATALFETLETMVPATKATRLRFSHAQCTVVLLALAALPIAPYGTPVGPRRRHTVELVSLVRFELPRTVTQFASAEEPTLFANATTEPFPQEQPAKTWQQTMSFLLHNSSFTNAISNATKECLAVGTGTMPSDWGLWSFDRFSSNMVQLEYFCNVPDSISNGQFVQGLVDWASKERKESGLTDCVRRKEVGFVYGQFYLGREPEDREDLEHNSISRDGGSPAWIPGVIIGVVGLVCLVGALVTSKGLAGKRYDPSDYDAVSPASAEPTEISEDDELRMMADGR
jgi:hypothetical protein